MASTFALSPSTFSSFAMAALRFSASSSAFFCAFSFSSASAAGISLKASFRASLRTATVISWMWSAAFCAKIADSLAFSTEASAEDKELPTVDLRACTFLASSTATWALSFACSVHFTASVLASSAGSAMESHGLTGGAAEAADLPLLPVAEEPAVLLLAPLLPVAAEIAAAPLLRWRRAKKCTIIRGLSIGGRAFPLESCTSLASARDNGLHRSPGCRAASLPPPPAAGSHSKKQKRCVSISGTSVEVSTESPGSCRQRLLQRSALARNGEL
mmetsp:Transcript_144932/g.270113  ORF Transcript_144932/g.270113 Transcript_144932/m.270113 type:complete len:273 (-) Transcript_144932:358-1176(-)